MAKATTSPEAEYNSSLAITYENGKPVATIPATHRLKPTDKYVVLTARRKVEFESGRVTDTLQSMLDELPPGWMASSSYTCGDKGGAGIELAREKARASDLEAKLAQAMQAIAELTAKLTATAA